MLNFDIAIGSERVNDLIVSFDTMSQDIFIGYKEFKKPGEFKYDWIIQYMDKQEALDLASALLFAVDHMPDECAVCDESAEKEA